MAGRYCEGKMKMASEKVSRKMVLEIKYVNAKTRIVQMIELVFIWLCQQGLEEEESVFTSRMRDFLQSR